MFARASVRWQSAGELSLLNGRLASQEALIAELRHMQGKGLAEARAVGARAYEGDVKELTSQVCARATRLYDLEGHRFVRPDLSSVLSGNFLLLSRVCAQLERMQSHNAELQESASEREAWAEEQVVIAQKAFDDALAAMQAEHLSKQRDGTQVRRRRPEPWSLCAASDRPAFEPLWARSMSWPRARAARCSPSATRRSAGC